MGATLEATNQTPLCTTIKHQSQLPSSIRSGNQIPNSVNTVCTRKLFLAAYSLKILSADLFVNFELQILLTLTMQYMIYIENL